MVTLCVSLFHLSIYKFSFLFSIVVDPTNLSEGLHYYELYGVDCKAPWRGPLFRIPITITKPISVISRPPLYSFSRMSFLPGMCTFSWLFSLFLVTSSFICSRKWTNWLIFIIWYSCPIFILLWWQSLLLMVERYSFRPHRKEVYWSTSWCHMGWSNHANIRIWYSTKIFCWLCSGTACSQNLYQIVVSLLFIFLFFWFGSKSLLLMFEMYSFVPCKDLVSGRVL